MYMTKPLSVCRASSSVLDEQPNDGPYSGFLVYTDNQAIEEDTYCWGASEVTSVRKLPFPQDRILNFESDYEESAITKLWFIPVLDKPLSSNLYYVISAEGKYRGMSCRCSREEDKEPSCCFGARVIKDMKPATFDQRDIYQQFRICRHHGRAFYAQSLASDGFPPEYLRKKSWEVHISHSYQSQLFEASGLNAALRDQLPEFDFSISDRPQAYVVVGKWYCPFTFVREEGTVKEQMKRSRFYKMTLEQRWEEIHMCDYLSSNGDKVHVNVDMKTESASLFGVEAVKDDRSDIDGIIWFRVLNHGIIGTGARLGLSTAITDKIKWLQTREGWIDDREEKGKGNKVEIFTSDRPWKRFACYVLVERFVLTRLDGSILLTYDFSHKHKIRCKWE